MAIGKRQGQRQEELWIPTGELARSPGHPFYEQVNRLLGEADFDLFVEQLFRGPRRFRRLRGIKNNPARLALYKSNIGECEPAHLVYARDHFVQAIVHVQF